MADRELLELAAKAALGRTCIPKHSEHLIAKGWDPLNNDGDALRLAVRLRMQLLLSVSEVTVIRELADGSKCQILEKFRAVCQGEYAATRRAIVRAAAMPEDPA